jgi:pyruvate formate lyase activating enzyme
MVIPGHKASLVFDIKRYSINDGPGIRVTVFFKGCSLSCAWCHNPESQSCKMQKLYAVSKCISCETCLETCQAGALTLDKKNGIITEMSICTLCGECATACPTKAIEMCGQALTVEEIMQAIRRERIVMMTSRGGVTFSGGEPLLHPEMLLRLLKACGLEGIHRAVDTAGNVDAEVLLEVAKYTDLFLFDLKHMDPIMHQKYTGKPNGKILENLNKLSEFGSNITIRIPLIEGVNADEASVEAMAAFIAALPGKPKPVNLLPYHGIATRKYEKLGGIYEPGDMKAPDSDKIAFCRGIFENYGIMASVGG